MSTAVMSSIMPVESSNVPTERDSTRRESGDAVTSEASSVQKVLNDLSSISDHYRTACLHALQNARFNLATAQSRVGIKPPHAFDIGKHALHPDSNVQTTSKEALRLAGIAQVTQMLAVFRTRILTEECTQEQVRDAAFYVSAARGYLKSAEPCQ